MPINPTIQLFLSQMRTRLPVASELRDPLQLRAYEQSLMFRFQYRERVHRIEEQTIWLRDHEVKLRVYRPDRSNAPCLVYFHGGGYVAGTLDTHDPLCRTLCRHGDCVVVSVEYRRAPEHKFPAAVEDAYGALSWVARHADGLGIDSERIAVGGDSAGGTLATVAALIAAERGGPDVMYQLLFYPATGVEVEVPPSMHTYGRGYILDAPLIEWFQEQYFEKRGDARHPYAAPILSEHLHALPPASMLLAEYDPLRDVGQAYADKLIDSGVPVNVHRYEGLIHGFVNYYGYVPEARRAVLQAVEDLRTAFSSVSDGEARTGYGKGMSD